MLKMIELFAGYGSQALALRNLGLDFTSDISEIDPYAIKAYEQLHGEVNNLGDIKEIEHLDYYDLWTYSFPCQDLSVAGKQAGIKEGTRSGLLLEVEYLLEDCVKREVAPKYLLLENVKALVSKKFMPDFQRWLNKLEELGYNNYWKVLNAKDYGIPQNRERVFVVSIRKDIDTKGYKFPSPVPLEKRLKDMLEPCVDEKYYLSADKVERFLQNGNVNPSGKGMNGNVCTGDICNTLTTNKGEGLKIKEVSNNIRCGGGGSLDGKHTWDIIAEPLCAASRGSPTLNTCGGSHEPKIVNGHHIRKLTPRECWRLMGVKDEEFDCLHGISNTQLYKLAGNSIVVNVLEAIFKKLLKEE